MAVSLDDYGPYDAGIGANRTEDFWRKLVGAMTPSAVLRGVNNELKPFGDSTGMQVKVDTGAAIVKGQYGENTAGVKILPIAAVGGIPGGQSRIDRVVLRNDFVNNRMELDVLAGTPAASPTPPALTQSSSLWEVLLGEIGNTALGASVGITNATTTISAGMVLDGRWKMTESGVLYYESTPTTSAAWLPAAGTIPAGYFGLEIDGYARSVAVTTVDDILAQVNSDTGTNYYWAQSFENNATPTSSATPANAANMGVAQIPAANAGANVFGWVHVDFPNYGSTVGQKPMEARGGGIDTASQYVQKRASGLWNPASPAAITVVKLFMTSSFTSGSRFIMRVKA